MHELDDNALLREYVDRNSEEAFAMLVARHVNKVYSVALRHTRNPHAAEEITQAVFVILAQKSRRLRKSVILSGWLYHTARLASVTFLRGEIRRARREQEAHLQSKLSEPESDPWRQIEPLLDAAMAALNEKDRYAIVLRFFDGKSMKEVGATIGATEDATKMRVNRAVEKMRAFLVRRGVAVPSTALASAISIRSVQPAPVALAKSVSALAVMKGATASTSTLTLTKGALKIMAWTKAKTAIVVSAAILLAAGAGLQTLAAVKRHLLQKQEAHSQIAVPETAWSNTGFASPNAAITTFLWAIKQGDGKTILGSFTPDGQQHWQNNFAKQMRNEGKSLADILAQEAPKHFSQNNGFNFIDQKTNSPGEILLHIYVPGEQAQHAFWFKKIGDEWKIDNFE